LSFEYQRADMPAPNMLCDESGLSTRNQSTRPLHYWIAIFLGAFLLFLVQPLLAKYFLPWFGGAPAVWTTCMLFFQLLLLAGYAYAHGLASRLTPRVQAVVHCALLLSSLILLCWLALLWPSPLTPGPSWKPHGDVPPIGRLLTLLVVSVGLPYFVLSTTGPLLQAWFARTQAGSTPYRLYAVSNLASLLALLSYPFLIEPWLTLRWQARIWSLAFVGYLLACTYCALQAGWAREVPTALRHTRQLPRTPSADSVGPGWKSYVLWLALAASGSTMFLASTTQLCQNIAVVPLLWIVPLSLYLLSFAICFEKPNWYVRGPYSVAYGVSLFAACYVLSGGAAQSIVVQVLIYSCTLFIACMICHGELHRAKPEPSFLTSFYLMLSLGGALGGLFVGFLAPHIFSVAWEYEIGLWLAALLMLVTVLQDEGSWIYSKRSGLAWVTLTGALLPFLVGAATTRKVSLSSLPAIIAIVFAAILLARPPQVEENANRSRATVFFCGLALLILGGVLISIGVSQVRSSVLVVRNFYGVLAVREQNAGDPKAHSYELVHGRVAHGWQFSDPSVQHIPTSYYGLTSGVGRAILRLRGTPVTTDSQGLRIGVVGLGIGTLAAYCKPADYFRFYEINSQVVNLATKSPYFSFVNSCRGNVDTVLGDARLSLEDELRQGKGQGFDLLVIDAFSGDAIPVHLLTAEVFEVYLRHITPDGVIAVHITNTYLDLNLVVEGIADHMGLRHLLIQGPSEGHTTIENSWMLLSRNDDFLRSVAQPGEGRSQELTRAPILWTDEYSDLLRVLNW
jgi:hypothetical protein